MNAAGKPLIGVVVCNSRCILAAMPGISVHWEWAGPRNSFSLQRKRRMKSAGTSSTGLDPVLMWHGGAVSRNCG